MGRKRVKDFPQHCPNSVWNRTAVSGEKIDFVFGQRKLLKSNSLNSQVIADMTYI